jgi:hypothetical protein
VAAAVIGLACSAVVDPDSLDEGCPEGKKPCTLDGRPQCVRDDSPTYGCAEEYCGPCLLDRATPTCSKGECSVDECHDGYQDCDGEDPNGCETDLVHDRFNCGVCDRVCSTDEQTAYVGCHDELCEISCKEGFGDCDEEQENGCEVDLTAAADHCGECSNACGSDATCRDGECVSE